MPTESPSSSETGDVILVMSNFPDAETARQAARQLVEEQLAACVNVLAPAESIYRWEGSIESESEVPVLMKSTLDRFAELEARIQALHPYEVPEIIAVPIIAGSRTYLDWVQQMVQDSPEP